MLKYRLIGENDFFFDPKKVILENRGVDKDNMSSFLNPKSTNQHSYKLLKNMDKAVECFISHVSKKSRIHIIVDADCDGYASSALLYNGITKKIPNHLVSWTVHPNKQHGIFLNELTRKGSTDGIFDFDLLIVPDAGSNDAKECEILKNNGIDVIILDHHTIERDNPYAIVVNPQLSEDYPNKEICGTAVVYKFLQALSDKSVSTCFEEGLEDLVALATISDIMDTRELENRYFIKNGIENINNDFLEALIQQQSFSINGRINIKAFGWYIAPLINAVTRVGTYEERVNTFRAFIDPYDSIIYKRGKKEEEVLLCNDMARQLINIKKRQDAIRDRVTPSLLEQSTSKNVLNIVELEDSEETKSMKGVLAMKVATSVGRPTLVCTDYGDKLKGSARGLDNFIIRELKKELLETGLVDKAQGHENAFGVSFKKENKEKIIELFNEKYTDLEDTIMVDFVLKQEDLTKKLICDFDKFNDMYGQNFDQPYVYIESVHLKQPYINDKKSLMSFTQDSGIEYKLFFPTEDDINNLTCDFGSVIINVVATLDINKYRGKETHQVIIEKYEVVSKNTTAKNQIGDFYF